MTRAREAEQRLRKELNRLEPIAERAHELEERVFLQRAELRALSVDQNKAELAVRRAASLEESLNEAKDAINELKDFTAKQSAEIARLRNYIATQKGHLSTPLKGTSPPQRHRTRTRST